jgi:putative hydrolase of HD superfamily
VTDDLLTFLATATRLKTLDRAGWRRCGVDPCESVADHTFGVALLALILPNAADLDVDRDRVIALSLVHDLAESIVGDITPHDGVDPREKRRREEAAIRQLAASGGPHLLDLWTEFEAGETSEAKLARDLDVIEMAWQARQYERAGKLPRERADQFVASARQRVATDAGRRMLDAIDAST